MKKYSTISEMFFDRCESYDREAFGIKENGEWISYSHKYLLENATAFALGLDELGYKKGDRVGIVSENRLEWVISDMACCILGLVSVPVFPILTPEQLDFIFGNCGANGVIVSSEYQANKILKVKDNLANLKNIIGFDSGENNETTGFKTIIKNGKELKEIDERIGWAKSKSKKVLTDDIFSIIYTSGTTGNPKGVTLSHKNICSNIYSSIQTGNFSGYSSNLSYLPFCHAYERIGGYYVMFCLGSKIYIAESIEAIASNISEIKPELISTVPKLMDTVKQKTFMKMKKENEKTKKVFDWAIHIGTNYVKNKQKRNWTPFTNIQYKLAFKLVFSKISEKLGGNLKMMVAGGAAMNIDTAIFFEMIGVKSVQGYGLTEASPVISCNNLANNELDTVGEPVSGVEVKIADDGEILAKGDNIMTGYWNDKEATEEVIDKDGWLHTGDIGEFTKYGNLKITDRKKNIFVSSGGKNIAPAPLENALMNSKYIDQVVLIGDGRDYCTCLIYPNFEELEFLAKELRIEFKDKKELKDNSQLIKQLSNDFNLQQKEFSKFEQMRRFKFLPKQMSVESGELTPKLSVKRAVVLKKYSKLVEEMY